MQFNYGDTKLIFYGVGIDGDIRGVFYFEEYKILKPENEIVIDIGASIGDSAIYFALNRAKHVIALEPYLSTFNLAVQNIKVNNLYQNTIAEIIIIFININCYYNFRRLG